jgi:adhesin/invasin
VTAGGAAATITVQLRDAQGNQLTTGSATVLLSATTGTLGGVTNNGNGTYTASFTGGAGTSATISGTLDGANITDTEVITVNPGTASAAQSTATVPSGSVGSVTTITVQARDAFGNNRTATSGTVVGSITGANNTSASVTDNLDGTYTLTYTPTTAGADAVAITLGGTAVGGSPYTSVVATGGLNDFLVEKVGGGNIATQTAGTGFDIRITARDIGNNTVTSFTGTVTLTSSACAISGEPVVTAAFTNGVLASHTATITNTGSCTITATRTSGGSQAGTSNSFTVNPGALDHFAVTNTSGGAIATQTAGTAFNILITAQDANNNTVTSFSGPGSGGHKVILTSTGTMTGAPITTANFSSGTHTQSVTLTNTGSFTITATKEPAGPETGTSAAFTVDPGTTSAAQSTVVRTGGNNVTADGVSTSTITVTLHDANGNPVPGRTVALTDGASPSVITPVGSTTSDANGQVAFTVTDTLAETVTYTATATDGGPVVITQTAQVVFVAGALDHFAVEATGGGPIADQADAVPFTVRITAQDAFNNTVTLFTGAGNTVTMTRNEVTGTGTLSTGSGATAAFTNGVLASHTVAITITVAGDFSLTATRTSGGSQSGTSNTFQVN